MRVKALNRRYDDGRMDVETEGVRVFRLLQFQKLAPGKLYPAGRSSTPTRTKPTATTCATNSWSR
jgi:hypothetical protein